MAAAKLPGTLSPTHVSLSAALALIESMEPANELEAALAVDVAVLHAAATAMIARVTEHITDAKMMWSANAAARLERAFHSAVKTYHQMKHGYRQIIRIERIEIRDRE